MDNQLNILVKLAKNINILYVEDNKDTRDEVLELLSAFFQNITVAVDGVDGLEKFNDDIDLVITDINMPKMNGLDMIRSLKKINKDLPVLVFSAYDDVRYLMQAIDLSVDGYLMKPISYEQYVKEMKKVLENIQIRRELNDYKLNLEQKVQEQIYELKEKDEMLERHAKYAVMGEMIDIIAHQWKQPLSIISMRSLFLEEMAQDGEEVILDDIIKCSVKVKEQVTHLVDTLDQFRGFLRPVDQNEFISVNELFDSLEILLHDDLIKNQIIIQREFDDMKFMGNKNEFKHIFINLINNARDAFVQNKIDNRKINILLDETDQCVLIKVKDNAGGIPKNIIENIFEPNFTTKENMGGTGIGLYMCKTIVDKHNASINVDIVDDGTVFILEIPKG